MSNYIVYPPRVEGKPHVARIEHFDDLGDAIDYIDLNADADLEIAEVLNQSSWFFKLLKWLQKL